MDGAWRVRRSRCSTSRGRCGCSRWASRCSRDRGPGAAPRDMEGHDMRVMMMIKGDPEAGARPSDELLVAMGRYNHELKEAGVLVDLAALHPSGEGKRVRFSQGERAVIDGPFGEKD